MIDEELANSTKSIKMDFSDLTSLSSIEQTKQDGKWVTISGITLDSKPTQKGIYINNGKKTVIR